MSIQAILFDVEGVIAHPDEAALDAALLRIRPGLDGHLLFAARNTERSYPIWVEYSVGAISPERYWQEIARELELDPIAGGAALAAAQHDSWWATLDAEVLGIVDELRAARGEASLPRLGILSNSAPEHDPHIEAFADRFDVLRFSHRVGLRKPDPAAYLGAVAALGVAADGVVFIDDKVRNTRAAAKLGMTGILFKDAATLREELSALGGDALGLGPT